MSRFAIPAAVEADFGHQQRAVARNVLQAREVGFKARLRLQVNVEANQIQERKLQVLGSGIVHISKEAFGVLRFCRRVQLLQKTLHPAAPVPAHDRSRDLVTHRVAQDGRVAPKPAYVSAHAFLYATRDRSVFKKGDVLLPRQTHHDSKPVAQSGVEQPDRRRLVNADGIDAMGRHP